MPALPSAVTAGSSRAVPGALSLLISNLLRDPNYDYQVSGLCSGYLDMHLNFQKGAGGLSGRVGIAAENPDLIAHLQEAQPPVKARKRDFAPTVVL